MENAENMQFAFRLGFGLLFTVILAWVFSVAGGYFGATKNRYDEGRWLGFLFGPFGWVLVLLMPTKPEEKEPQKVQTKQNPTGTITGF